MRVVTVRLPDEQIDRLTELGRASGRSRTDLVRDAIAAFLGERGARASLLDRVAEIAGSVEGPADLSVNPDYLRDFGR